MVRASSALPRQIKSIGLRALAARMETVSLATPTPTTETTVFGWAMETAVTPPVRALRPIRTRVAVPMASAIHRPNQTCRILPSLNCFFDFSVLFSYSSFHQFANESGELHIGSILLLMLPYLYHHGRYAAKQRMERKAEIRKRLLRRNSSAFFLIFAKYFSE